MADDPLVDGWLMERLRASRERRDAEWARKFPDSPKARLMRGESLNPFSRTEEPEAPAKPLPSERFPRGRGPGQPSPTPTVDTSTSSPAVKALEERQRTRGQRRIVPPWRPGSWPPVPKRSIQDHLGRWIDVVPPPPPPPPPIDTDTIARLEALGQWEAPRPERGPLESIEPAINPLHYGRAEQEQIAYYENLLRSLEPFRAQEAEGPFERAAEQERLRRRLGGLR